MRNIPPDRWARIDALFTKALEIDARGRPEFLDRMCGDDGELRAALEELLAADTAAEQVLGEHAADFASGLVSDLWASVSNEDDHGSLDDLPPGSRLGPYRIDRELGRGGMGRVFLAERADDQFEKRVALKLVKRGMDSDEILRRFRQERQILASLEHPGIARLLDGGVAPDGRPWLAMEYVEGRPLDRWLAEDEPSLRQRLELLARICDAVQHAHRRLVVHRDLKPSNVLVDADGQPRLLDFGIAKLLSDDEEALRTRTGVRIVTPELAAPEQLRGEPAGVASDVHGLGVLLFYLLTGERPYTERFRTGEPEGVAPRAPSTAVADGPVRRRIAGDLDLMTARALHPDAERRYGSAADLAADLRRWIEGRPVEARPDSLGYRLRRFVGRNRAPVAAVAVTLVGLGVFGAIAVRERVERDREARASLAVSNFMEGIFEASDPFSGGPERLDTLPVFALLDRALERMDEDLGDNPRARARLLHTLGKVYLNSGATEQGDSLLREAVALRRVNGEPPSELGASLMFLARASLEAQRWDEAEAPAREGLALGDDLDPEVRAALLANLGVVHQERGEVQAADSLYRASIEQYRAVEGAESHMANILSNRGALAMRQGDFEEALPLVREALAIQREVLPEGHPELARGVNNLAVALRRTGDPEGAEPLYREALAIMRETLRPPHPMLVLGSINLASTLTALDRDDEAEPLMTEAAEQAPRAFPSDHPDIAAVLLRVSRFHEERAREAGATAGAPADAWARADLAEAERLAREALRIFSTSLGAENPRTVEARGQLGEILVLAGQPAEAEPLLLAAWELVGSGETPSSHDPEAPGRAARRLVELYEAWGRPAEADRYRVTAEAEPAPR